MAGAITSEELYAAGTLTVACTCGHEITIVDRYATDFPPGPRGDDPDTWVEFYTDSSGDPDDRLIDCPGCGRELRRETVTLASQETV